MLTKQKQRNYFEERWNNAFVFFAHFAKKTNEHDLHRMRVELKKIKALLKLHEKLGGKAAPESGMKALQKVFSQAGDIRNAQVSAQLLKHHHGGSAKFFTEQRKQVAHKAKKFVSETEHNMGKLTELKMSIWKNFRNIPSNDLTRSFNRQLKKAGACFSPRLKVKELHNARKLIKRIVYTYNALNKKTAEQLHLNTDYLHNLENQIGKWHDVEVTQDLLKKQAPQQKAALTKLNGQKQKLVEHITVLTRRFREKIVVQTGAGGKI